MTEQLSVEEARQHVLREFNAPGAYYVLVPLEEAVRAKTLEEVEAGYYESLKHEMEAAEASKARLIKALEHVVGCNHIERPAGHRAYLHVKNAARVALAAEGEGE